ncbi:hypothetical protein [Acinetobacter larvae]|uniref:MarR family transcriptional regulator n=1 Tax=Acinetobacter larvae TaxID=1789224 RepID=A0A1B2LZ80_9GAMM|nr:hypothetical protein [Acinetobacter larvae]AOA58258.1 hypothetical protein BFG52_07750 [Acinetobacter larvae]
MTITSQKSFEKRLDIIIYAVHATKPFMRKDIALHVINASLHTASNCLTDLVELGYLKRVSIYHYEATEMARALFSTSKTIDGPKYQTGTPKVILEASR